MIKLEEVAKVMFDLVERKVGQHVYDLGSKIFAHDLLYLLMDELTHETLKIFVLRDNIWEHTEALHVVCFDLRVLIGQISSKFAFSDFFTKQLSHFLNKL